MAVSAEREPGFFRTMFDIEFSHFVTPKVVGVVYALSAVSILMGGLFFLAAGLFTLFDPGTRVEDKAVAVGGMIAVPVIAVLLVLMVRLYLELVVVLFRTADFTRRTAEVLETQARTVPPASRANVPVVAPTTQPSPSGRPEAQASQTPKGWTCPACGNSNTFDATRCRTCNRPGPDLESS